MFEWFIYGETNLGRWYVRPLDWCGEWDQNGKLVEGLNCTALCFTEKDAEFICNCYNKETDNIN